MTTPQKDTAGSERDADRPFAVPVTAEWRCPDCGNAAKFDHRGCNMRARFEQAMVDAGHHRPERDFAGRYTHQRDEDRFAGWSLRASQPSGAAGGEALTDSYVQTVPDKCDRIVWRNNYYHLPLTASLASPSSGGWQWVPKEPTPEMAEAGLEGRMHYLRNLQTGYVNEPLDEESAAYRAMLNAAPPAPKSSGESHE